jgi:hypothetical protein
MLYDIGVMPSILLGQSQGINADHGVHQHAQMAVSSLLDAGAIGIACYLSDAGAPGHELQAMDSAESVEALVRAAGHWWQQQQQQRHSQAFHLEEGGEQGNGGDGSDKDGEIMTTNDSVVLSAPAVPVLVHCELLGKDAMLDASPFRYRRERIRRRRGVYTA